MCGIKAPRVGEKGLRAGNGGGKAEVHFIVLTVY